MLYTILTQLFMFFLTFKPNHVETINYHFIIYSYFIDFKVLIKSTHYIHVINTHTNG